MVSPKVFWIFIVIVVIIAGGLIFAFVSTQQEITDLAKSETFLIKEKKTVYPLPATGNVDDTMEALLKEVEDENSTLGDLEGDASLIDSDSQEVDDFGQSVNENDF
jgi:hypothetical protein